MVSRPVPSDACSMSCTSSAATSDTRNIASLATERMAASRSPMSEPGLLAASVAAASTCAHAMPATCPRPRLRPARRNPASTRSVAAPVGEGRPLEFRAQAHRRDHLPSDGG